MGCSKPQPFNSQAVEIGDFDSNFPIDIIKNEPMFFNCDLNFAYKHGGPITQEFIGSLYPDWESNVVFDSRVHMLMKNWYPCIPGYHHDDVPRGDDGQPNYDNPSYYSEHLMGLVNGDICPTIFALGKCEMPPTPSGEIIYKQWHLEVVKQVEQGNLTVKECPSGKLIQFNWQSFHTGQKAKENGWRWFGRLSRNTERTKKITNEIRRQVQVYLEFPMEGW